MNRLFRRSRERKKRKELGGGIVEGLTGLWLIVAGVVGGLFLLVNVGLAGYHQQKLAFITHQAADQAKHYLSWNNSHTNMPESEAVELTTRFVDRLLRRSGLPAASDIDVEVTNSAVSVTVAVNGLALLNSGNLLPSVVSLRHTSTEVFADDQPPALLNLGDGENTVLVPSYGRNIFGFTSGRTVARSGAPTGTGQLRSFRNPYGQFEFRFSPNAFTRAFDGQQGNGLRPF